MFLPQVKTESQFEIDAATLRAMVDFTAVCDPESVVMTARRPFRLDTQEGAWTGAFLPDFAGAVAVQAELTGNVINTNSRLGRGLSWCLKNAGVYAREMHNVSELERRALDAQECGELLPSYGQHYQPGLVLSVLRALGAPDPRVGYGHFTHHEPICGVENPSVWALSGTVARVQWRAFLLPVVEPLQFADGGGL